MKNKLKTLDLFSGIGGLSLGLNEYCQTVCYCENDIHAQAVLIARMNTNDLDYAPIWDDIKTLNKTILDEKSIQIDIIVGGFPCQDISVAGRGAGLEGKRSGLFFEILRLAKEIQPQFIFLENVPAIRKRGLATVISQLAEAGYDCRYGFLSAYDLGAPHKRERWFMLAHRRNSDYSYANIKRLPLRQGFYGNNGKEFTSTVRSNWWAVEPGICRVANEIPLRVDRIKRLGNSVVPQQAKEAFERLIGIK